MKALGVSQKLLLFLLGHGAVNGALSLVADVKEVVQIIASDGRHGKYLAGIDVHGYGSRAVLYIIILDRLIQRFFNIVLYCKINRRNKIQAVFRACIALVLVKQEVGAVSVGRPHIFAGCTAERGVILSLQTVKAVIIRTHKAYHMAGERGIWIIALGVAFKAHTLEAVLRLEFADLIGSLLLDLFCDRNIP